MGSESAADSSGVKAGPDAREGKQSPPSGSKRLLRPALVVTAFIIGGQVVGFLTQIVVAAAFGARSDMDAFLAANTLPQYTIAVLLGALASVFIPVFVDHTVSGREAEAWKVASGIITLSVLVLGGLSFVGILFAKPLLRASTPGLSASSLNLATAIAVITWPTVVATGLISLLSAIYQAQGRFGWQAAVPFIGALVNLALVIVLTGEMGVVGVALAATIGVVVQVAFLMPVLLRSHRFKLLINWDYPGVRQVVYLLVPLLLSGLFVRLTPIVDRYLASDLAEGSISHLGYSYKILVMISVLIGTGLTTVIFPRMATNLAGKDENAFKHTVSLGLRSMWIVVAPVIVIGSILAQPLVTAVLQRHNFLPGDSASVAQLLKIYLPALIPICLGNITGRALYALKLTRVLSIVGAIEATAYVFYTVLLARWFGIIGIVWGYVIYFNVSLLWQIALIWYKTGRRGGRSVVSSFTRTGLSAILGGVVTWGVSTIFASVWAQIMLAGISGLFVYVVALGTLGSPEVRTIWDKAALRVRSNLNMRATVAANKPKQKS